MNDPFAFGQCHGVEHDEVDSIIVQAFARAGCTSAFAREVTHHVGDPTGVACEDIAARTSPHLRKTTLKRLRRKGRCRFVRYAGWLTCIAHALYNDMDVRKRAFIPAADRDGLATWLRAARDRVDVAYQVMHLFELGGAAALYEAVRSGR